MKTIVTPDPEVGFNGRRVDSPIANEARQLWTRIQLQFRPSAQKTLRLGFCSTHPGEGTTTVAANFAFCLGQQGLSTCLVEANLRSPALAGHFGVHGRSGLGEVLTGDEDLESTLLSKVAPNVDVLPAGRPPADLFATMASGGMQRLLESVDEGRAVTVVDCPPLSGSPEVGQILQHVDGVVLVVQANRTRKRSVTRSIQTLRELGVRFAGAVLNRMTYDLPVVLERIL